MLANIACSTLLLLFINVSCSLAGDEDPTLVTLPYGQIKGHVLQTANGNYYYAFQEIPYAAPPVKKLRFKEPAAPGKWYGILDTTKNTKICYQQTFPAPDDFVQSEDCLYLNVYIPANKTDILPVLVWIHGGGYISEDGTYQSNGPQFFIDYDVAVVTLNYRLGPLGFLTTEDGVIPGNLGLKDQNFALQWVKQNINLFGGDPERVTIVGVSAGASAVGLQLISKKSKGLFRGAIMESGTAVMSISNQPFARYLAFELGRTLGSNFTSQDSNELLNLLQNLPVSDIINAAVVSPWEVDAPFPQWRPVIEDERLDGAFVTGPMDEDIKNGNINQVPIIIGFNSEEYLTIIGSDVAGDSGLSILKELGALYDSNLSTLVDVLFNMTEANKYTAGSELRSIYTDGTFGDDIAALIRYSSDFAFTTPAVRHAELQSKYTDVYLYQFSYSGVLGQGTPLGDSPINIEGLEPNGVGHGEEIFYFWARAMNNDMTMFPAKDRLVQSFLLKLWTNFIKYQNPTPERDASLQNIFWPKVSQDNLNYLNINSTLSVQSDPKQYKKWKEIINKYAIPPFVVY